MAQADIGSIFFKIVGKYEGKALNQLENSVKRSTIALTGLKAELRNAFTGLIGLYSGATFIKSLADTATNLERIKIRFDTLTDSQKLSTELMQEADNTAERFGLRLNDVREGMSMFIASTKGSSITMENARKIYINIASAVGGMRLSQEEAQGALLAFSQIVSKGKIQAEELRRQLANRMPGAFALVARTLYPNVINPMAKLDDELKKGNVGIQKLLEISVSLRQQFGKNAEIAAKGFVGSIIRMQNSMQKIMETITIWGFTDASIELANSLNKISKSKELITFAKTIGTILGGIIRSISFLIQHLNIIFNILSKIGALYLVRWIGSGSLNKALAGILTKIIGMKVGGIGLVSMLALLRIVLSKIIPLLKDFFKWYLIMEALELVFWGLVDALQTFKWFLEGVDLEKINSYTADLLKNLGLNNDEVKEFVKNINNLMIKFNKFNDILEETWYWLKAIFNQALWSNLFNPHQFTENSPLELAVKKRFFPSLMPSAPNISASPYFQNYLSSGATGFGTNYNINNDVIIHTNNPGVASSTVSALNKEKVSSAKNKAER